MFRTSRRMDVSLLNMQQRLVRLCCCVGGSGFVVGDAYCILRRKEAIDIRKYTSVFFLIVLFAHHT